jgi:mRNA interferase HicA
VLGTGSRAAACREDHDIGAATLLSVSLCPSAEVSYWRSTGNELLRRLRRLGSERGVAVRFDDARGKGSHGTIYFGDRITVLKDRHAEIKPGLLHAILRRLGLSERDRGSAA